MDRVGAADPFAELKISAEEYTVYDSHYERIGRVNDVFLDEQDRVTHIGVQTGLFGTNSTLIPVEILRVNDRQRLIEVAAARETIEQAPHFGQKELVSPELEDRIRIHFGLEPLHTYHRPEEPYPSGTSDVGRFGPDARVDTEPGERAEAQEESLGREQPERRSGVERPRGEEPLGERPVSEPGERWERITTQSGMTVHRRKRR